MPGQTDKTRLRCCQKRLKVRLWDEKDWEKAALMGRALYLLEELRDDLLEALNHLWVGRWWALAADYKVTDIPAAHTQASSTKRLPVSCLPEPSLPLTGMVSIEAHLCDLGVHIPADGLRHKYPCQSYSVND